LLSLQKETDQPAGWLKEVLNDMAFQNKRGPNKDLWELQKHLKLGGAGGGGAGGGEAVEGEAAHLMQE
jgi:transcription initiation factor TFIIF subunit beta